MSAILTLQLPLSGKVLPLATSTAPAVILRFCKAVYLDYQQREQMATDEVEAVVYRAELDRLRRIFAVACPELLAEIEGAGDDE